jgi:enoyl-CoA hydratase/carnithine racemase
LLKIERHGAIAVWTVDRPQVKNALDVEALRSLLDVVREASRDADLRAAVLTGEGHVFISGADLREFRNRNSPQDAELLSDAGYDLTKALAELPFPVIAALPGPAIGGGAEIALACDMRIADVRARMEFKQVRMGVTTSWGAVPRLAALVGSGTAARLLYTGHEITAAEGKLIGLIDDVTENGLAKTTALAWASDIALGSPKAIAEMKHILRQALAITEDLRTIERRSFIDTWSAPDHRDAVDAWFERRQPRWGRR